LKGIYTNNNNNLRRLFLDFSLCGLNWESGIYLGELFSKLPVVEDLTLIVHNNPSFGEEGV